MVRLTVLTVKKLEFPKSKTASILKITVKSPDLSNRLTDFDEIWHDDRLAPYREQTIKISNFSKNHQKISISPQRFHRSFRNLVC